MFNQIKNCAQCILSLVVVSAVAAGCSSKPLAPEDRNLYDGMWVARITETYRYQHIGSWDLICTNMQGDLAFKVENGVITTSLLSGPLQQALHVNGKFKVREESPYAAHDNVNSSIQLNDATVVNILRGKLDGDHPKGHLDNWVVEAGAGCTTKVDYFRVANNKADDYAAPNIKAQFVDFYMRATNYSGSLD